MINSLRPLLVGCPVVLQQKWHWEHLSMLPDNAHKCEICQSQYVNNHNCTGRGHVQANPTEMLLDDNGMKGFQSCDSLQMLPEEKQKRCWRIYDVAACWEVLWNTSYGRKPLQFMLKMKMLCKKFYISRKNFHTDLQSVCNLTSVVCTQIIQFEERKVNKLEEK